jgi:hypothetical protein
VHLIASPCPRPLESAAHARERPAARVQAGCNDRGVLFTWGGGTYGKLGQQDTMNSLTPRPVKSITSGAHFVQVECGTFHTVALTKLGDVYTFGFNGNGRLGLAEPCAKQGEPNLHATELSTRSACSMRDGDGTDAIERVGPVCVTGAPLTRSSATRRSS